MLIADGKLLAHARQDTLREELAKAVDYAAAQAAMPDWRSPLGNAAATSTPAQVTQQMSGSFGADVVVFGGTLGMLDLHDRVKPMDQLDMGRMRWACEVLDQERTLRKLSNPTVVRADFLPRDQLHKLQRVERDADLDVAFWHYGGRRPSEPEGAHPMKDMCRYLVFCA